MAEWILRLVLSRERATAAVGDLLEDSEGREPSWFWTSLGWTVACTIWRETQTHGLRLAGVAAASFFLLAILSLCANLAAWFAWEMVHFTRDHTGLELLFPGDSLALDVPAWVTLLILRTLVPFEVGRWAARHARNRELSAWFVMMLLWPVLADVTKSPYDFAVIQFSLLGIIWQRWRSNRLDRPTAT